MVTHKKFRVLLICFTICYFLLAAGGLIDGSKVETKLNQAVEEGHNFFDPENKPPVLLMFFAAIIGVSSLGVIALNIISILSLFFYLKIGPKLFLINVILSEILYTGIANALVNKLNKYFLAKESADTMINSLCYEPLHFVMLMLSGAILSSIYLFGGKKLFVKTLIKR